MGILMASRGSPPVSQSILMVLSMFFLALSAYIYNDVVDVEMDRLNPEKKNRPYALGVVSRGEAMGFVYMTSLIAYALSLLVSFQITLLCVIWLSLFLAYSNPHIYLKRRIVVKEGTPAIGLFFAILIGAYTAGPITANVMFSAVFWGSLIFISMPAFRDTTDIKEDTKYGVKSLASVLSWKRRLELIVLFFLVTMTLTPLTYVYFEFNIIFPIVMVAMSGVVLRFLFPLLSGIDERKYAKMMRAGFVYMIAISMSMVLGSLPLPI
jgi:4-hydroxybenzoate polyprenyltransferase